MTPSPQATSVTVVVVTWQGRHLIGPCLDSLRAQTIPHRILVVDNASTDGTVELLHREHPDADVLVTDENLGFAGALAVALPRIATPYVALLNNDATADPSWLQSLVRHADAHPRAGAITSRMVLADAPDTLNNTGVRLLSTGYGTDRGFGLPATSRPEPDEVFGFSGGAALLRTAAVRDVGGFPAPFFLYYEDTDVSWRLRLRGWTVRYEPEALVTHQHSATVDQRSESFAFFNERNRLLTLARCAPARFAVLAAFRFLLTTASLSMRRFAGQAVHDVPTFRFAVRLRVLASYVRLLPWALRSRRQILGQARVRSRDVVATWGGRDA
jgi:GT2 family glycosyltransferase